MYPSYDKDKEDLLDIIDVLKSQVQDGVIDNEFAIREFIAALDRKFENVVDLATSDDFPE